MSALEWVAIAVVVLFAVGWYLSYSAARLDRLHGRVEATLAALDAQLVRRAEATIELVNSGTLDAASALMLAGAATESLQAVDGDDADRERVESDLTDALSLSLTPAVVTSIREDDLVPHMRTLCEGTGLDNKSFLPVVYDLLLGRPKGPKVTTLVTTMGGQRALALLEPSLAAAAS